MEDLIESLKKDGYTDFRYIENRGLCCISRFAFTYGVIVNADITGYDVRYCFHTYDEAKKALEEWSGEGHVSGNWIKAKGSNIDIRNPNYKDGNIT